MMSSKKKAFTYTFNNEKVLREMSNNQKGGILISAHLGNWGKRRKPNSPEDYQYYKHCNAGCRG